MKYQFELANKLRNNELSYQDASIYTILLDLVGGNGIDEVFMMLHNVAFDLDKRKEFEEKFESAKNWEWAKK